MEKKPPMKKRFVARPGGSKTFATESDRQVARIVELMPFVPVEDYTTDGKPRVEDLEALAGENFTEEQRDEAFALFQKPAAKKATKKPASVEEKS